MRKFESLLRASDEIAPVVDDSDKHSDEDEEVCPDELFEHSESEWERRGALRREKGISTIEQLGRIFRGEQEEGSDYTVEWAAKIQVGQQKL